MLNYILIKTFIFSIFMMVYSMSIFLYKIYMIMINKAIIYADVWEQNLEIVITFFVIFEIVCFMIDMIRYTIKEDSKINWK